MAIMRDQQGSNLNPESIGTAQVYQSQASGSAAPRDTRVSTFPVESLARIMNMADTLANKYIDKSQEEGYVQGQNAAVSGLALDQLNSNWLTASAQEGGYNDQTKRMQMAQQASTISAKMPQYQAMDPKDFLKVVQDNNRDIFSDTDGMTMKGRQQLMENQLTFNNTLIQTQAAQHGQWQINQRAQMYNAQGNALATIVAGAKASGDGTAYAHATAATMTWAKSILSDDKLPMEARQKQVTSLMGLMLSQDSRQAVEQVVNSGLLNSLPSDQLAQLQGQIRESKNRTTLQDNQGLFDTYSQITARQGAYGDVPLKDFNGVLQQMVNSNAISPQGYMSAQEQYLKNYAKTAKAGQLANAFAQGDQTGMLKLGASQDDAADAYVKTAMKLPGATSSSVAQGLLNIGVSTGFPSAYKKAAQLIEPGLSNFGTVGQMSPDAAQSVTSMLDRITVAEQHGDTMAFSKLLSGLSPENQEKLVAMREQIKAGKSVDQAGENYMQSQQKTAGLTPSQKSQLLAQRQTDINKSVNSLESQGFFSRTWQGLAGVFSENARNQYQARVASGDIAAAQELGEVSAAYREELQAQVLKNPNISTEGMQQLAMANVAARVTRIGESTLSPGSVLVAPRGRTVQSMLGLAPEVASDRIGAAIAALNQGKAPSGYDSAYSFNADGSLQVQYFDKKGNIAPNTYTIPASAVQTRIREDDRVAATANNEVYGEGKLYVDPQSNIGIRVNGVNTAGIDEQQMLQARGALINLEGIRNQVYRDTTGVATNGVGISNRSPEFAGRGSIDGRWTPQDIHDSFINHTNRVANSTRAAGLALGWDNSNNAQFQFMMQIGYQGGENWYKAGGAYGRLADAIRTRSPDVMAALHQTPAYKLAGPERQKFYESSLMAGMQ